MTNYAAADAGGEQPGVLSQWESVDGFQYAECCGEEKHVEVVFEVRRAYFELLKKYPEAGQYLALGSNVTVELGGTVYDVVEKEAQSLPGAKILSNPPYLL